VVACFSLARESWAGDNAPLPYLPRRESEEAGRSLNEGCQAGPRRHDSFQAGGAQFRLLSARSRLAPCCSRCGDGDSDSASTGQPAPCRPCRTHGRGSATGRDLEWGSSRGVLLWAGRQARQGPGNFERRAPLGHRALAGEILGTWFRFPFHSILPTKTGTFPGPSLGAALAAARIWNLGFRRSAERIGMCPNWRMCRAHTAWDFVPLACISHHGCPLGPSLAVWDRCLHEGYRLVWRAMPEFFLSEWLPHGSGVPSER
jgi:hypothetical protein